MKRLLPLFLFFQALLATGYTQNVFNPDDPIIRYDKTKPYGSEQHPDTNKLGLQKWVSTPTNGVSLGVTAWDASSFKQYYINTGAQKMAFRIKFPKSYKNPDSANKKYPIDVFLHGGGEVGCTSNGRLYNNEKQVWLGGKLFMQFVDQNKFDGFLVYPQLPVGNNCFFGWGSAPTAAYRAIVDMIDSLAKYARADMDRVLVTGLSGGGYGAWRFAEMFPGRIAKIMPSAAQGTVIPANRPNFVHVPIWFATGALDADPSPQQAEGVYNAMKALGANIRYTQYPERGHQMWQDHWREADFPFEMNDMHKANALVFFQRNEFCNANEIDAKLGITQGFHSYEWKKDGETIALRTGGVNITVNLAHVHQFEGNNIRVKSFGSYSVRFKRTASSEWSAWSLKPAIVKTKSTTQTAPITIKGSHSRVLPSLDGDTTVPLTLPDGFQNYEWFTSAGEVRVGTSQVFNAGPGVYKARYQEQFGCGTAFSPDFRVVDANGSPKPAAAANVTAVPLSETVNRISWTDGAADETGYEVYRATASGGPYTFVALTAQNASSFRDSNLAKNTLYYYVVRAVNETGASEGSNEAVAKTRVDNIAPTAPSNLQFDETNDPKQVNLSWTASQDQGGIERYDIYVNGKKSFSSAGVEYTATGLDSLVPYRFTVVAVDSAGNSSPASNQVTYLPPGTPGGSVPAAPTSPEAQATAYNKITISWTDASNDETGFEIVRSATANGTYTPVGSVAANVTSFTDSGLTASQQYFYRVRAVGRYGESAFSPNVNATTPAAPATPVAPTGLSGFPGQNNTISISWTDNSGNENAFVVYRSTDNTTFDAVATLPANNNAYTDTSVVALTNYYYYVAGRNGSGVGEHSNTVLIRAGNNAPIIGNISNIFVRATTTATKDFTVGDDSADVITITVANKPAFVTIQKLSAGNYRITASPGNMDVGSYNITVNATDNSGKSSSKTFTLTVGNVNVRTVYLNFGSTGKAAPAPWNNWLGNRNDGDMINGLADESGAATAISVTTLNGWALTNNMGHITGNNSGAFPDAVLQSGLMDSSAARQIKISGLSTSKQYNLVFVGSRDEGYSVNVTYAAQERNAALNSRYNANQTANLNNLTPDANGEIIVTITRTGPAMHLNGIAIEEIDPTLQLLAPNNIYAEALDRNRIKLTWSDRTNNETGYDLLRATDSAFTNAHTIQLPPNTTEYINGSLTPNTKYWYKVRARGAAGTSDFSNRVKAVTPNRSVHVNFNATVENAPSPWNNLESSPQVLFVIPGLKDHTNVPTTISLSIIREFNGEFTSGINTGNNSGIAPDKVLQANYWLDKLQLSRIRLDGLNHGKMYRIGFIGSSGPDQWHRSNYTATYTVKGRTVYLNSWFNSTKIAYIGNVTPDPDGKLFLDFSTTPEADWAFNSGFILDEYDDVPLQTPIDTIPADTSIVTPPNPPDTTDPGPNNPPDTTDPGPNNPPDTTNPNPNNPPDTTGPNPNNPPDTTGPNPNNPPVDTPYTKVSVYPNPVRDVFNINFYNNQATDIIDIEICDQKGQVTFRRNFGTRPVGSTTIPISSYDAGIRSGVYLVSLKINGELVRTLKLIRLRY